jgi:hypothetical protein
MPGTRNARDLQVVDAVLTNVARAYKPHGFIYDTVFPSIPVTLDSGLYPIFDGFFDDDVDNKVQDRAETPEIDFTWSTDTYLCEDYRLKASITAKEERNAHSALKLRQNKLDAVLMRMAIRRERRAATLLRKTDVTGGALNLGATPSTNWDQDAATIEADVATGKLAVYNATGMVPNTIVIPYAVAVAMSYQQDIRDILKYTVNGQDIIRLGEAVLPATIWGLRVIIPMGAMRNTANEGAAKSLTDIWGDHVRILYVAESGGGWGIPSVAYSFKAQPEVVDRWRSNDPPVEYVRAWECLDEKVCAPDAGYVLSSLLS